AANARGKAVALASRKAGSGRGGGWQGHDGMVTGVGLDALNRTMTTASVDGRLVFWSFMEQRVVAVVEVGSGVSRMELVRDTDMVALACDDHVARLYDLTTKCLVRRLVGHTSFLTDMCFTSDARRLLTASTDHSVR
ncbi:unnamed protein product, partial [Discosporangium mesarthrocarpum]